MPTSGHEILEHTADVGIRAWGRTVEEAFEQAGWGLAEILGARANGSGERRTVHARADDTGALLVDFLNELLLLHEREEAAFSRIEVRSVAAGGVDAGVDVVPIEGEPEGTAVKAATYQQLRVGQGPNGTVEAIVYLDV